MKIEFELPEDFNGYFSIVTRKNEEVKVSLCREVEGIQYREEYMLTEHNRPFLPQIVKNQFEKLNFNISKVEAEKLK